MKTTLFSILAAATLFVSAPSFATAPAAFPFDNHGPYDRLNDRNDKDFNYGFDKRHRVTSQERARWEAAHRDDRRDDRRDNRFDDRNSRDFNYGYDRNHRVTDKERARWEAAHRYDGRR
ncbi:hypothetical protein [Hymenobacter negativus]|uniref:Uncharacterized protein n=1 Tax=Hymenobacter negativus TaxID=2795026 RepID=A0ABS3QDX0_9BACT|nr:hypothetical protein [Hymenobacter negativus]MBO2009431.1 hypothetical protein [Hymenobacter negativus]